MLRSIPRSTEIIGFCPVTWERMLVSLRSLIRTRNRWESQNVRVCEIRRTCHPVADRDFHHLDFTRWLYNSKRKRNFSTYSTFALSPQSCLTDAHFPKRSASRHGSKQIKPRDTLSHFKQPRQVQGLPTRTGASGTLDANALELAHYLTIVSRR